VSSYNIRPGEKLYKINNINTHINASQCCGIAIETGFMYYIYKAVTGLRQMEFEWQ